MDSTDYSLIENLEGSLMQVSFYMIKKGQSVYYKNEWYKALEDAHVNDGMIGFRAEDENFEEHVIQFGKNDLAYAPPLFIERVE